ncbi:MAG TPA: NAD kinase [Ottowia sp.]|uniref:NAD kinase n=1 Tax=Ottowia sp. TaxID=1898956 RepID=UPI002C4BD7D0|nr:NAD kinase [Ottowia sp.]HMN21629.1 NAD kinase [Ottowia sp.]
MSPKFTRVALVGKYQDPVTGPIADSARELMAGIGAFLQQYGCSVTLERRTAELTELSQFEVADIDGIGARCELCVVVGGDGTMLGVGRQLARHGTPLIGINQGRLGFITDIALDDYPSVLPAMLAGAFEEDLRALLLGRVCRDGACVYEAVAMNDVVVNRGAASGMVELRVEVDGHFVANYRADGIIVATPTGSTAYSLSAGGPLLHPQLPGWALVPISPHTLSNRPIVLADPGEIAIEIVAGRDANASFDMQSLASLRHGDRIVVRRSEHQVRFLHPRGWSYFDTLREKLHWTRGGG